MPASFDKRDEPSPRGFCPWYPLAEAERHAPDAPGVFQVRLARGLLTYARGKSAMIHYAYADDLRAAASQWARDHESRARDWLCRHITGPRDAMAAELETLRDRFVRRFGSLPRVPPIS